MPYVQGMRFGQPAGSAVKTLVMATVAVFLLQFIMGDVLIRWFGLTPAQGLYKLQIWQFVSYIFLHGGFWHIAMNMFMLWMFGSELERLWGRRPFLNYFFVTGVGAGLIYALLMPLIAPGTQYSPLVGASGSVYGILTAYAVIFPDRKVYYMFLPIPIPVRWLVLGYIALEMMSMWSVDGVGHLAHLGGALVGFLWLKGGKSWLDSFKRGRARSKAKSKFRVVDDRPRTSTAKDPRVDEILEKISREGYDSLTPEELDVLRRASKH